MKKKLFLMLCALFAFIACDKEELFSDDNVVNECSNHSVTRAASDIPDILRQLDGMPIHIKSVYNHKYLSATPDVYEVLLNDNDDGSLRQRWYLKPASAQKPSSSIVLVGGNSLFGTAQIINGRTNGRYGPVLTSYGQLSGPLDPYLHSIPNSNYYHFKMLPEDYHGQFFFTDEDRCFVRPNGIDSRELISDNNIYKGEQNMWEVIPVDEFRILDITYDLTTGDDLAVMPKNIATKTLSNDTDEPATRTLTFQESVSNESSFSQMEKLTVTIREDASLKFGIPDFGEGTIGVGTTSAHEWSYTVGQKETHTTTITETVVQVVPPRTTITARLVATEYTASLTYIAKLYGLNTNMTIYLKGKWTGVVVQESRIDLYYPDGRLIRSLDVEPK